MYLPPPSPPPESILHTPRSMPQTCSFEGNPDIYGPGIRVGIYCQTIAVWFANYFLSSQVLPLRDTVTVFTIAVLISLLMIAADPTSVYAVEAFLMLQILTWGCLIGVVGKSAFTWAYWGARTAVRHSVNQFIDVLAWSLQIWFWWGGMDRMKKMENGCVTWMMYIWKVDLFGWARKVMMVVTLLALVSRLYWCAYHLLESWIAWEMEKSGTRRKFVDAVKRWEEMLEKEDESTNASTQTSINPGEPTVETEGENGRPAAHETCSENPRSPCPRTESLPTLDREATLVQRSNPPATLPVPNTNHSSPVEGTSQTSPISNTSGTALQNSPQTSQSTEDLAILQQVRQSELYIEACISACPFRTDKPLTPGIFLRSLFYSPRPPLPNVSAKPPYTPPPSWISCFLQEHRRVLTFDVPRHTWIFYTYLRTSMTLNPLTAPFQLYASLTYIKPLPSWHIIALASNLLVLSPSRPKKVSPWLAWYFTFQDLLVHVLVILQVELTLRWNGVTGLMGLRSVGQLIPCVIGVTGLVLVASRWVSKWWSRKDMSNEKEHLSLEMVPRRRQDLEADSSKRIVEGYRRWKESLG
ncbi:unnamed protein product [Periconia digitata]|uniref:Uncharacterized protein n=1 Tax=Periconia digitata TaxID=1303443 RepID=A0A9W4UC05_9PLEO|nr:unnamed protein product [Periconia digitata]